MADDPNKRNISRFLGYFGTSDIDTFLSRFNHENNYCDGEYTLNIGDEFRTLNGISFVIAGFDLEHNRKAEDGTVYDNGYGIMLYPRAFSDNGYWNTDNTTSGGYINSLAHNKANNIGITMKNNILGTHLVNRNVLLSSSIDSEGFANAYTWTTAYGTLPSLGQLKGIFSNFSGFDQGEANYKLPLFNYINFYPWYDIWTREIYKKENSDYYATYIKSHSMLDDRIKVNSTSKYYHTLLYIR